MTTKSSALEATVECSGVARICCEEGQSWKVGLGALTAKLMASASAAG